ncbi:MAG: hypothetical protein ACR2IA_13250 [Pyrinomonadaceae bacterium]
MKNFRRFFSFACFAASFSRSKISDSTKTSRCKSCKSFKETRLRAAREFSARPTGV